MLWIRHLDTGAIPVFAEIGRAVGEAAGGDALTGQAVSGWLKRDEAPDTYRNIKALASVLGAKEDWLIGGVGDPPRPDLWATSLRARGRMNRADLVAVRKQGRG
jgi:hypothetical protein